MSEKKDKPHQISSHGIYFPLWNRNPAMPLTAVASDQPKQDDCISFLGLFYLSLCPPSSSPWGMWFWCRQEKEAEPGKRPVFFLCEDQANTTPSITWFSLPQGKLIQGITSSAKFTWKIPLAGPATPSETGLGGDKLVSPFRCDHTCDSLTSQYLSNHAVVILVSAWVPGKTSFFSAFFLPGPNDVTSQVNCHSPARICCGAKRNVWKMPFPS